jgi:hypothetical protein
MRKVGRVLAFVCVAVDGSHLLACMWLLGVDRHLLKALLLRIGNIIPWALSHALFGPTAPPRLHQASRPLSHQSQS